MPGDWQLDPASRGTPRLASKRHTILWPLEVEDDEGLAGRSPLTLGLQGAEGWLTAWIRLVKSGRHQAGEIHRIPENCVDLQGKEGEPGSRARAFVPGVPHESLKTLRFRVGML